MPQPFRFISQFESRSGPYPDILPQDKIRTTLLPNPILVHEQMNMAVYQSEGNQFVYPQGLLTNTIVEAAAKAEVFARPHFQPELGSVARLLAMYIKSIPQWLFTLNTVQNISPELIDQGFKSAKKSFRLRYTVEDGVWHSMSIDTIDSMNAFEGASLQIGTSNTNTSMLPQFPRPENLLLIGDDDKLSEAQQKLTLVAMASAARGLCMGNLAFLESHTEKKIDTALRLFVREECGEKFSAEEWKDL